MFFCDFPIIGDEEGLPLYLINLGKHVCQPRTVREEGYAHPQVLYCTRGSGMLTVNKKHIPVKERHAVFLPAGLSKQQLCRLFNRYLGSRPMEYVAKRRIQAAKELLTSTKLSIEEISERVGFCSGSYFCKLFCRYEGMTPSHFRDL